MQLTDRETQILVPNVVERSGHNILTIREMMQDVLRCHGFNVAPINPWLINKGSPFRGDSSLFEGTPP